MPNNNIITKNKTAQRLAQGKIFSAIGKTTKHNSAPDNSKFSNGISREYARWPTYRKTAIEDRKPQSSTERGMWIDCCRSGADWERKDPNRISTPFPIENWKRHCEIASFQIWKFQILLKSGENK